MEMPRALEFATTGKTIGHKNEAASCSLTTCLLDCAQTYGSGFCLVLESRYPFSREGANENIIPVSEQQFAQNFRSR